MTRLKDTSIIASSFTMQYILENIHLGLSILAGIFTCVYAATSAIYAIDRLKDYLKNKNKPNKKTRRKK